MSQKFIIQRFLLLIECSALNIWIYDFISANVLRTSIKYLNPYLVSTLDFTENLLSETELVLRVGERREERLVVQKGNNSWTYHWNTVQHILSQLLLLGLYIRISKSYFLNHSAGSQAIDCSMKAERGQSQKWVSVSEYLLDVSQPNRTLFISQLFLTLTFVFES